MLDLFCQYFGFLLTARDSAHAARLLDKVDSSAVSGALCPKEGAPCAQGASGRSRKSTNTSALPARAGFMCTKTTESVFYTFYSHSTLKAYEIQVQ